MRGKFVTKTKRQTRELERCRERLEVYKQKLRILTNVGEKNMTLGQFSEYLFLKGKVQRVRSHLA